MITDLSMMRMGGRQRDPYWANVALLLDFEGDNGSSTFVDRSILANTVTSVDAVNCSISTADFKFGASSLRGTGANGGRANVTTNLAVFKSLVNSGVQSTVEFFVKQINTDGIVDVYVGSYGPAVDSGWEMRRSISTGNFELSVQGGSVSFGSTIPLNQWVHLAITNDGTTIRGFVNGVLCPNTQAAFSHGSTEGLCILGRNRSGNLTANAYMDSLRVTNGVCRYTSSFDVPTNEHPLS